MPRARLVDRPVASRTDRHRADPIKRSGIHYTSPPLADFVAEQAARTLDVTDCVRLLDPACGDGALLESAARALPTSTRCELHGFDLDATALREAQRRLRSLPGNRTVTLEKLDFLGAALDEKESRSSLRTAARTGPLAGRFDLVIANPPYVRTQLLGAQRARELAEGFGLGGRVDLYHAFAMAILVALRPGGVMALLCSNRFLTTKSGEDMRNLLASAFEVVTIFDLGDTKPFEAAVLPAVVIARRDDRGTRRFPMAAVYEDRSGRTGHKKVPSLFGALATGSVGLVEAGGRVWEVRRGHVETVETPRPWVPTGASDRWILDVEAAAAMRFRDLGRVRVGVKTTADGVFIREAEEWEKLANPPEPDLLLPLITHHVARAWQAAVPSKRILYPYRLDSSRRSPVDLVDWPGTAAYLDEHREQLSRRKYVVDGGRHWWEIWVPQRPAAWAAPKIVWPDISEAPRFFYDRTGAVVNGDCYWLTVDDERLAYLMMAVANSALGRDYYDAVCGNKLYAGRRRYITQYVELFPVPDPSQTVVDEIVKLVQELIDCRAASRALELEIDLDGLVRRSFGLE